MDEGQFNCLVSRAMPGLSLFDIKWHVSMAEARSYIHTAGLLNGTRMVWADETQRPEYHAFRHRMKRLQRMRRRLQF